MPIFWKSIASCVFVAVLAVLMLRRSAAPRTEFHHIRGTISYLDGLPPQASLRARENMRYLMVSGSGEVFALFVGHDPYDFSPAFEQLDSLRVGETVDLYVAEAGILRRSKANNLVQFIDRANVNYFTRGDSSDAIGWVLLASVFLLTILLLHLKRIGRIV